MSVQPDSKKRKASCPSSSTSVSPLTTSLLKDALSSLPADSFWNLVSSSLLPHVNSLPSYQIKKIKASFQDAIDARHAINTLDSENRESELDEKLDEFRTSVDTRWKQEADEQGTMMTDVVFMITEWLEAIFDVCVEDKEELALGHDSFLILKRALHVVSHSDSRTTFEHIDYEVEVGRYSTSAKASEVLAKTWRDFILVALAAGQEDLAIKSLKEAKGVEDFESFVRGESEILNETTNGYPFDDEWYSAEMKTALPRLRALLK